MPAIPDRFADLAYRARRVARPMRGRYGNLVAVRRIPTDATASWTPNSGNAQAAETTLVQSSMLATPASIRMTPTAGTINTFSDHTVSPSVDVSGATWMRTVFYVSSLDISNVSVNLDSSGGAFTAYQAATIYDKTGNTWTTDGNWIEAWWTLGGWSVVGTPNLAAINRIRFRHIWTTANNGNFCVLDELSFWRPPSTRIGRHFITFDDGGSTQWTTARRMNARGLRGTFYVLPARIGTTGYLTLAQLRQMQEMGHLVANHTWDHDLWVSGGLTTDQKIASLQRAADWLEDNGFAAGARHFCQPGGNANLNTADYATMAGRYADTWRLTGDRSQFISPLSPKVLTTQAADSSTTALTAANRSSSYKCDTCILHHTDSTVTDAYLDGVAALRDAGTLEVATVDEL